jgi:DNA/RNA-binding protein KIN17
MKARGLTKLRFYCQVCGKANRDEHAFKMHTESESHMRQLAVVGQNAGKAIDDFSKQFQDEFVSLLSRR